MWIAAEREKRGEKMREPGNRVSREEEEEEEEGRLGQKGNATGSRMEFIKRFFLPALSAASDRRRVSRRSFQPRNRFEDLRERVYQLYHSRGNKTRNEFQNS